MTPSLLAPLLVVTMTLLAFPTAAQPKSPADREAARAFVGAGHDKLDAGNTIGALADFRAADDIMGVPTTGMLVATALLELGRLIEAHEVVLRVQQYPKMAGEPAAFTRARSEAATQATAIAQRIPTVRVELADDSGPLREGVAVAVSVDGARLVGDAALEPRQVDPGAHRIAVEASGYVATSDEITLREGQALLHRVKLTHKPTKPPPAPSPVSGLEVAAYVTLGIGGAALAAGIATGVASLGEANEVKELCPELSGCPPAAEPAHDRSITLANVSNVSFGVAGIATVASVVMLAVALSDTEGDETESVTMTVAPNWVGVSGWF